VDEEGTIVANTIYFLPVDDPWVLSVLNAPIAWWFAWREAQHGKDEALRYMTPFMEAFPIPEVSDVVRTEVRELVASLRNAAAARGTTTRTVLDWLRVEFEVAKPTLKLQAPADLDANAFVTEVRKSRAKGKMLTVAALAALREEHARTIAPVRAATVGALTWERRLCDLVNAAYGLTTDEVGLMWETAPPRMPLGPTAPTVQ
jgi:hypothetical protein